MSSRASLITHSGGSTNCCRQPGLRPDQDVPGQTLTDIPQRPHDLESDFECVKGLRSGSVRWGVHAPVRRRRRDNFVFEVGATRAPFSA
jgi:hypothetical protein